MQELFSQLEIEHPNLFNTNTLEGRKFINDYYKFFKLEKEQIVIAFICGDNSDCTQEEDSLSYALSYYNETFKIEKL